MKLTFLGTRGGITARSHLHWRHSSLLVTHRQTTIIIDWGEDWLRYAHQCPAQAVWLTHAHPDHAGGLLNGFPYPVYATKETWNVINHYPIKHKKVAEPYTPISLGSLTITACPVKHSLHAPAVGYRISSGKNTIFYVSDLAGLILPQEILHNVDIYIGDGAIITRRMLLRKKEDTIIGHAPIAMQIEWCKKYKVPCAIFTHCGSEIVKHNPHTVAQKIERLGNAYGIATSVAYDGMTIIVKKIHKG
ncbi:MAG: MBL fold metallo-hydrolase [Candidatus Dependentiae bacterium]|nr:MBL fold metallo-hydrolase [Candidatus Dependentiae bacterium]